MTRFDKMPSWWPYEGQNGHTNSTRKWTITRSFGNFLACQRICNCSLGWCWILRNSGGGHMMAYDALMNGLFLRSEPNWNISFIACPSGVNLGTVWQRYNTWAEANSSFSYSVHFRGQYKGSYGKKYINIPCPHSLWVNKLNNAFIISYWKLEICQ